MCCYSLVENENGYDENKLSGGGIFVGKILQTLRMVKVKAVF